MLDRPELQEFFQSEALAEAGRKRRAEYTGAEPFPHIVMDGFFPEVLVRELAAAITPPDDSWIRRERDNPVSRACIAASLLCAASACAQYSAR